MQRGAEGWRVWLGWLPGVAWVGFGGWVPGRGRLETGPYARMGGTTRGRSGTGLRRVGEASIIRDDSGTGRRVARPRRLREYDYSQDGAYSVTICTDWRKQLFGQVTDGRMALNAAGRAVEGVWNELPAHYPHVELDVFVVMPDHVHGIVVFVGGDSEAGADSGPALGSATVGSRPEEAGYKPAPTQDEARTREGVPTKMRRHGLSEVVRGFKTYSGRRVNELRGTPGTAVWQRGFYEHVVRNEEDLNRIRSTSQGIRCGGG